MKAAQVALVALSSGFVGGVLGTLTVRAIEPKVAQTVRARSFELVNQAGTAISFWGFDKRSNVVLTFGALPEVKRHTGRVPVSGLGTPGLDNPNNQLATIGLNGGDTPFLEFNGADEWPRAKLFLRDDGKPILLMEDDTGPRLSLGLYQSDTPGPEDNDWALVFDDDRARIGMRTEKIEGVRYIHGFLGVDKDKERDVSVPRK